MFLVSQCRGDSDLGLCTTSRLAFGEPRRNNKIRYFLRRNTFFFSGGRLCASVLKTQVPKSCTDLDLSLLYILILGTYSNFARKNNFLALGVCLPQPCSSAGRMFAASRSRVHNYRRIVSFAQQKFRLRWGWVFLERTRILSGIQFTTHLIEILIVQTKRFVGGFVHVILTRQTCSQRSSRAAESKRRALENSFFRANLLHVPSVKM